MGRLIDADKLIEVLTKYKFGAISNDTEREVIKETVLNFVKEQPTAYDAEKVVAGIKAQFGCKDCEYADVFPTPMVCSCECAELEVINDICDIVKAGGKEVNED